MLKDPSWFHVVPEMVVEGTWPVSWVRPDLLGGYRGAQGPPEREQWRSWRPELPHTGLHRWPGAGKTTAILPRAAPSAPSIPQCPQGFDPCGELLLSIFLEKEVHAPSVQVFIDIDETSSVSSPGWTISAPSASPRRDAPVSSSSWWPFPKSSLKLSVEVWPACW